jgi:peptidoglycan/LPS O-acetylase OafA/YrhL
MTESNAVQPTAAEPSPSSQPPEGHVAGNRLAWLDVLRGWAALCVVFNHFGYFVPHSINTAVYLWIDPGDYGVFVFFIISGYIIPASLERKGNVRTFWVSRIFRLYPLYLLAVGGAVALWAVHVGSLRGEGSHPATSVLSQLLMMSNVLAGENLPNVVWSLSYEMIFYLLLTALFMAHVHRRSSRYALAFGVAAVAFGGLLPQAYFTHTLSSPRVVALVADVVVITGLALGSRPGRRCRSWRSCSPGRCCTAPNKASTHGGTPLSSRSSCWGSPPRPDCGITAGACPATPSSSGTAAMPCRSCWLA